MRVLITGAAGMLGTAVGANLRKAGHRIIQTDLLGDGDTISVLDIRNWKDVRNSIEKHRPELVLHLAAETDVDRCEKDPDHAYATNTFGTENVAWACREQECLMVYISTGNVFKGEKPTPYAEFDQTGSVNVYGRTKFAGEEIVSKVMDRYFIFRAGWMVGGWDIDKKFVYKMVQLCRTEHQLKVVNDKLGSPTFTVDFADHLMHVIHTHRYGLYHMTNKGFCSRFQIAQEIVKTMGLEEKVEVCPVSSLEFPLPAQRPRSEMLCNFKLGLLGLNRMPHWKDSLRTYLLTNKEHW